MFSVDEIIARNATRPIPGFIRAGLRYLLHEKDFQAFVATYPNLSGLDFIEQALHHLAFGVNLCDDELENIPSQGPAIIVANHPIGSLDGLALISLVSRIRPDVKIVANQLLCQLKPLAPLLLGVDNMHGKTGRQQITDMHSHLATGGCMIIFPSGEVSRLYMHGIRDGRWSGGFLKLAHQFRAPIVPVYMGGRNSLLFYLTSYLCKPLSTLLLVREMFHQSQRQIQVKIGKKIPVHEWSSLPVSRKTMTKLFRKHLYRIGRGKSGILTTETSIALPEDRVKLKKLVEQSEHLGNLPDGKQIYLYRKTAADGTTVLKELGRLREIAFRAVGEGTGNRRDLDDYDEHYLHLILWDSKELEIVGAYRLTPTRETVTLRGTSGLYTHELFQYTNAMQPFLDSGIELGRSFIQPRYWGKRSLDYLWIGIGAFLARHPEYRYLFGPVSMSGALPAHGRDLLVAFYRTYFASRWPLAQARRPFHAVSVTSSFSGHDYPQDLTTLKSMLDNLGCGIPTLYKQYTELCESGGVQFLDFGVDPAFGNCIDGLVLVDVSKIKAHKRERYINCHLPAEKRA